MKQALGLLVLVLALTACGGGAAPPAQPAAKAPAAAAPATPVAQAGQPGGTLIFGLSAEPVNFDPHLGVGAAGRFVSQQVYRPLLASHKDGKMVPEVAESWKQESPTSWVFKLRPGVKFHNGDTVTAADVIFSFQRILDPKTGAMLQGDLKAIDKVVAADASTIHFTLKEPNAPFLELVSLPNAAIVSAAYTKANDLKAKIMGTGPFKVKEVQKGVSLTLEKATGFYKPGVPKLDGLKFVYYADESLRVNALRAGDVDMIDYVPWKDIKAVKADAKLAYEGAGEGGPFMYVSFNTNKKPFDDPRVRRALGYAIDRQAILDLAFFGQGELIWGMPTPKSSFAYHQDTSNYFKYDLAKAKQLLQEAGVKDGLEVSILSTSQYGMHKQTAEVVQADLKKLGINAKLNLPDWAGKLDQEKKGNYDIAVQGVAAYIQDLDLYSRFYRSGPFRTAASILKDDEIDRTLDAGRRETDQKKRADIYYQFEKRANELSPLIFLTWREQGFAYKKNVRGFQNMPGFFTNYSGITLEETTVK